MDADRDDYRGALSLMIIKKHKRKRNMASEGYNYNLNILASHNKLEITRLLQL